MTDWLADFDDLTRVVAADATRTERSRVELGDGDRVIGMVARRRPRPVVLTGNKGAWVLNGRVLPPGAICRSRGAVVHAITARAGGRRVARVVYLDYVTGRRGGLLNELVDFSWRPDEDYDVGVAVAMTVNGEVRPPWLRV